MRIAFMGTPDFAVPSLNTLHSSGHEIASVVTVPDKPSGRGQKMRPSAVKIAAESHGLSVLQPHKLNAPEFLQNLRDQSLDLIVVVAFRILPESCFTIPRHGSINLHASLLPKYRGAAPIQRAIMAGDSTTGVTTFFLKPAVDTGDMLLQKSLEIGLHENAGSVHDRLAELGAEVLLETVDKIESGEISPTPQADEKATPAPKIQKADCHINWNQPAIDVHNQVRALSPYPGAFTHWGNDQLKVYQGHPVEDAGDVTGDPGEVTAFNEDTIEVACQSGGFSITELQPAGKRKMSSGDFLNGYDLEIGTVFH
ncbi:MAG: methionyl-tRNA formyltransferase [Candidatus Marinimicrobia bacterium]|nr:methionyl-tRNA formyltransferase [Candidatus Neomarinimicrobiota bacterium]